MKSLEPACVIVSQEEDLHAFGVRHRLRRLGVPTEIICTDRLSGVDALSWTPGDRAAGTLPNDEGVPVSLGSVRTVWWRRLSRSVPKEVEEDIQLHLIGNDCEAALVGLFETEFTGTWIDHPTAIRRAENKMVQLRLAHEMGMSHPATLVTQDPARLGEFVAEHGRVVAKVLRGTNTAPLATVSVDETQLPAESVTMAPTIFQEEIRGSRHLRVVVFGDAVYAFRITSPHLDWRPYTDTTVELVQLDADVERSLKRFLEALHLRMGSFDLKIREDGEVVFLEVNPQGQFLFLQSKTGVDLAAACADYLASSCA